MSEYPAELILSLVQSMLNNITDNIRAVSFDQTDSLWKNQQYLSLLFHLRSEASEEDIDALNDICGEWNGHHGIEVKRSIEIIGDDVLNDGLHLLKYTVFMRRTMLFTTMEDDEPT